MPELHGEQDKHPQGSTLVPTAFPLKKKGGTPLSPPWGQGCPGKYSGISLTFRSHAWSPHVVVSAPLW